MKIGTMSDHLECALPKSESSWLEGIQLRKEQDPDLRRELAQFRRELEKIPSPHCGRIDELKEKIRKKTLLTREAIEEAAERLAQVFFGQSKL